MPDLTDLQKLQATVEARIRADSAAKNVPGAVLDALIRYAVYGVRPGDFLQAFLACDLMGVLGHADDVNILNLRPIGQFVHCVLGSECHGSRDAIDRWVDQPMTSAKVAAHG